MTLTDHGSTYRVCFLIYIFLRDIKINIKHEYTQTHVSIIKYHTFSQRENVLLKESAKEKSSVD